MNNIDNQIKCIGELIKTVLYETEKYKHTQSINIRKNKGQFFSSERIADYMGEFPAIEMENIKILDPGAGNGILGLKAIEKILVSRRHENIHITYVENDKDILPVLWFIRNELEKISATGPAKISCTVENKNFILDPIEDTFDLVVSNPPYFKISKSSPEAKAMESFVYGQPNIYALFIVKILQKMNANGYFTFITPRSWTSGNYFRKMRAFLFGNAVISNIHLFNERDKVFSSENVLQETMIWSGKKELNNNQKITITTSSNDHFHNMKSFEVNQADIISKDDYRLFLPLDINDYKLLQSINNYGNTFESLGYSFKTGPVVEFRNQLALSNHPTTHCIPMLRSLNIRNGKFIFPVSTEKAQYVDTVHNETLRIKNNPTIIVKRLSAKEEERRLQCCMYIPFSDDEYISIENHVNYLVRKDGMSLTNDEIEWAYKIISSEKYDKYFRMISGNTQVNAQDLNTLPVPFH